MSHTRFNQTQNRTQLRQRLRQARRQISPAHQALAAQCVARRLARHPWLKQAQSLAFYLAADGELNPAPLMRWALARGKKVFLPCLHPTEPRLHFRRWHPGVALTRNRFGIAEPPRSSELIAAQNLDVILLPLVGFDHYGGRLGMGGGFYDRTLAGGVAKHVRCIGLAHSVQQVARLSSASWDVPMALIATNKQLFYSRWRHGSNQA